MIFRRCAAVIYGSACRPLAALYADVQVIEAADASQRVTRQALLDVVIKYISRAVDQIMTRYIWYFYVAVHQ